MSAGVFHTHFPCSECARALVIVSEFVYISHVFFLSRSLFCFLYKCDNHNLLLIFRQYIQRERKRTEVNVIVLLLSNSEVKKETTYKCVDENKYRFLFSGSIDAVVSISIEWNSHFAVIFTFLIFKWTRERERGRHRDRAKKKTKHSHSLTAAAADRQYEL